jgi:hypothetical protein
LRCTCYPGGWRLRASLSNYSSVPTELAGELKNVGFQRTEILGAEEINAGYFTDRADGLRVRGGLGQLMGAWI